jgi:very-short-patch-repair endonuclease
MGAKNSGDRWVALQAQAASQHGLLTRAQLDAAGINGCARARLCTSGRLTRRLPGVYALVGEAQPPRWQAAMAASLWRPEGAVSHRTSAEVWALDGLRAQAPVDLVLAGQSGRRVKGLRLHRCQVLPAADVTIRHGVRVTSPERTLLDLAAVVDAEALAIALESAWRRGLVNLQRLWRRRLAPGGYEAPGKPLLRAQVKDCLERDKPFASALEVQMWRALKASRLKGFVPLYPWRDDHGHPLEIDFAHPEARVAVETRGWRYHGGSQGHHRNAVRTSRLTAAGWAVMPVSWQMMQHDPAGVVAQIACAVAERLREPVRTVVIVEPLHLPETLAARITSP